MIARSQAGQGPPAVTIARPPRHRLRGSVTVAGGWIIVDKELPITLLTSQRPH